MNLIVSLDISEKHNLETILEKVKPYSPMVKIGHFLLSQWKETYSDLLSEFSIFFDLKFLDIPNTVLTSLLNYKKRFPTISYYTIHGIAEDNLIKTCCEHADVAKPISVISLSSNKESQNTDFFLRQASHNRALGITNFVCPPNQIDNIKRELGADITIFVPGIRNEKENSNDHFSTINITQAKEKKVDYAIVGRPILDSSDIDKAIKSYLPN